MIQVILKIHILLAIIRHPPPAVICCIFYPSFRLDIAFWTSRGFAVLDVDYGGSQGMPTRIKNVISDHHSCVSVIVPVQQSQNIPRSASLFPLIWPQPLDLAPSARRIPQIPSSGPVNLA